MSIEVLDPALRTLMEENAQVERLATGFGFSEGPVWDRVNQRLIFSDMKDDHMRCWSAAHGIATFRKPSSKANGNTFDREGRLVSCEHATSRVVREEVDGSLTVLASRYGEKELNSPNDIVVKSDGAIYFSDPTYGRIREDVGVPRALTLDFRGVYRIPPGGGATQLLASDYEQPNGLCFSLDERYLYVNDTLRKHIRRYDMRPNGSLAGGEVWAETRGDAPGAPDGMKIDGAGNLYCTGPGGVHVFDPRARCLAIIRTPERITNLAWGEADAKSLFLTGITSLYRVRVKLAGRLVP